MEEKKKLGTGAKIGIGCGIAAAVVIVICFIIFAVVGSAVSSAVNEINSHSESESIVQDDSAYDSSDIAIDVSDMDNNEEAEKETEILGIGDTFTLSGLEVTVDGPITFDTIPDHHEKHGGKIAIRIQLHLLNVSGDDTGSVYIDMDMYGPSNTKLDDVGAYWNDSTVSMLNFRDGATQDEALYIVYDGDGYYELECKEFLGDERCTIGFDIEYSED